MVIVEPLGRNANQKLIEAQVHKILANATPDDQVLFETHSLIGQTPVKIRVGGDPNRPGEFVYVPLSEFLGAVAKGSKGKTKGMFILGSCQLDEEQVQQMSQSLGVPSAASSGLGHDVFTFDTKGGYRREAVRVTFESPYELQEFKARPAEPDKK